MKIRRQLSADIAPRLIRMRDAPLYLGMDRNRFSRLVRPYITDIPIGQQGVAFDRLELDAWATHYMKCNGRPAARRTTPWDKPREPCLGSPKEAMSGISTRESEAAEFAKALAKLTSKKRSST